METKGFLSTQKNQKINVLVCYLRFIWIPMLLCIYGRYQYFDYYSAGYVFRRQNLTSIDVRLWRLKILHRWKGQCWISFIINIKHHSLNVLFVRAAHAMTINGCIMYNETKSLILYVRYIMSITIYKHYK